MNCTQAGGNAPPAFAFPPSFSSLLADSARVTSEESWPLKSVFDPLLLPSARARNVVQSNHEARGCGTAKGGVGAAAKERAAFAEALIASLDEHSDDDTAAAWNTEIERRIIELDARAVSTIPW